MPDKRRESLQRAMDIIEESDEKGFIDDDIFQGMFATIQMYLEMHKGILGLIKPKEQ